ncbi:MAG: endolytic transglycosylase MltG [Arenicellales bacterium]|nr:endolytic transglycosylase MltG [Arenicellales bacterium]
MKSATNRWWVRLTVAALVIMIGFIAGFSFVYWDVHRLVRPGAEVYRINVGSGLSTFAANLAERQVIERRWTFVAWAGAIGQLGKVKAGAYRFQEPTTLHAILGQLIRGEVVTYRVTLFEGWTTASMRNALGVAPALVRLLPKIDDAHLREILAIAEQRSEGWFFPDTYHYNHGDTDISILQRAHHRMQRMLADAWSTRNPSLPLNSAYDALILASIVEKETAVNSEKPLIASVFTSRLARGMRLQADPTVAYGLGSEFKGQLRRAHLTSDTPYNTYTRKGLPPSPISNPGRAALAAATQPAETNFLYFVARGNGEHQFSATYPEHQKAVLAYRQTRRRQSATSK